MPSKIIPVVSVIFYRQPPHIYLVWYKRALLMLEQAAPGVKLFGVGE